MLDDNKLFKGLLEEAIGEWKEGSNLNFPIFYRIDFERNNLVLYSDRPGQLIGHEGETIEDLSIILKEKNLRFNRIDVKKFLGGVVA